MGTLAVFDPLLIADDSWGYVRPWPNQVLENRGDLVLWCGTIAHRQDANVLRVGLDAVSVERRIDDVRAWMAANGRREFTSCVGASTTPDDLPSRLLARGAEPDPDDPILTPMALDHEPPSPPAGIAPRQSPPLRSTRAAARSPPRAAACPSSRREDSGDPGRRESPPGPRALRFRVRAPGPARGGSRGRVDAAVDGGEPFHQSHNSRAGGAGREEGVVHWDRLSGLPRARRHAVSAGTAGDVGHGRRALMLLGLCQFSHRSG